MTKTDFKSSADLMLNNISALNEWSKIVAETTGVADYAEQARTILIEAENKSLEKQIDNLQSIKDSIGDINKQREKELDLIKARDALENAKKEIKKLCELYLAKYSLPYQYEIRESLPRTNLGKIDYKQLESEEKEKK